MKSWFSIVLLAAALLPVFSLGRAEWPGHDITLRVTESEGGSLPGATVIVTLTKPGPVVVKETRITDAEGRAKFLGLVPGRYDIRFELAGFFAQTLHDVPVGDPEKRLPADFRVVLTSGPMQY